MDFLSAQSNFLVQWFRNFDSKDLGLRDLGMWFRRISYGEFTITYRTVAFKNDWTCLNNAWKYFFFKKKKLKFYRCLDITVRDILVDSPYP